MNRQKILLGLLVLLALYLPFLNQAFHIDDPFFIAVGDQILKDWLRPFSFNFNSSGAALPVFTTQVNPPLHGYFLAGIIALFGHAEWALHLFSFLFVALFFLGMADLGRRFGVSPIWAGVLAAVTPAVMVNSHLVMPDLALTAFYLWAVTCFIRGVDSGRKGWLAAAGLCAAAAALTRYTGLTVLPLMALYAMLQRDRSAQERWNGTALALSIPVAAMILWTLWNIRVYGSPHLTASFAFTRQLNRATPLLYFFRFAALLHYIGGTTIFPLSLMLLGNRKGAPEKILLGVVLAVSALFGFFLFKQGYTPLQAGCSLVMLAAAQAGIEHLLIRPLESKSNDDRFLVLWFVGIFFTCVFQYYPAVRRLLLLVPAWVVLYLRRVEPVPAARKWVPATIAATLALGLCVSWVDYSMAGVHREFAHRLAREYPAEPGRTLWCSGHWGFQYYMEKEGALPYDTRVPRPVSGDRVIIASAPWPQVTVSAVDARLPADPDRVYEVNPDLKVITSPCGPIPLKTVSRAASANFHANVNHPGTVVFLPYVPSRTALETFLVASVREPKKSSE